MLHDFDNELSVQSPCVVCGEMCHSEIITGSRNEVGCFSCVENGDYDKYMQRKKASAKSPSPKESDTPPESQAETP